ncbi:MULTISPECIES: hypothetical protein [Giesbergeria]|uniref:Energy-coupling factor transport system substrate-specific component n=1 Tax=Giesbergeria sinuosa TaxID=80883 RepID=A0ABV9QB10_9BURK
MIPASDSFLNASLLVCTLAVALWMRPWRWLRGGTLLTPVLATLVVLPWMWALPQLHAMPLQLQFSGACMVTLMLGWPLAVPLLLLVAFIAEMLSGALSLDSMMALALWQGVLPATLALGLGALLRRLTGEHLFVYVLGRAFLGTAICLFASSGLAQWLGQPLPGVDSNLSMVAHWLMAWGDAFMTGMLTAVFVAFKPEWLATWSDQLYLRPPPA